MKTPFLDEKYCLEKSYYADGAIKSEKFMVHMAYIVFHYDEYGYPIRIIVNGTEYPPDTRFVVSGNELEILAD